MASINTVRAILSAIRAASHSQSVSELSATTRETVDTVRTVVADLARNSYIKEHSERAGTYFTRTPKRSIIAAFLDGQATLPGVTFSEPAVQPASPVAGVMDSLLKGILTQIKNAPHALPIGDISVSGYTATETANEVAKLVDSKVLKLDTVQNGFFTRKPMRTKVVRFLAGAVTLDQLLDPSLKNMPEMAQAPTPEVPVATSAPAVVCPAIIALEPVTGVNADMEETREFTPQPRAGAIGGLDELISELITVRDNAASLAVRACSEFLSGLR